MYEFNENAYVELQGPRVLELREHNDEFATYSLIGFNDSVRIRDYRRRSLDALSAFEHSDPSHDFPGRFSQPALVSTSVDDDNDFMLIELHPPRESEIRNVLWLAVGIDGRLPVLDYIVRGVSPLESDRYAIVALYKLDHQDQAFDGPSSFAAESTLGEALLSC